MTAIFLIAAAVSFLMGLVAGWLFLLPFNTFIVNTLPRAITVSAIAMAPMSFGLFAVGLVASFTGSDRPALGMAYLSGIAIRVIYERLSDIRSQA
jgi:hypothetical protein